MPHIIKNLSEVSIYHPSVHINVVNVFGENQDNPNDLTIFWYAGFTLEHDAKNHHFSFEPFSDVYVDGEPLPVLPGMNVNVYDESQLFGTLQLPDDLPKLESLLDLFLT